MARYDHRRAPSRRRRACGKNRNHAGRGTALPCSRSDRARSGEKTITASSVQQIAGAPQSLLDERIGCERSDTSRGERRRGARKLHRPWLADDRGELRRRGKTIRASLPGHAALPRAGSRGLQSAGALENGQRSFSARGLERNFKFASATPADQAAQQTLAATLVQDIRTGKYASGFGDSSCEYASCRDHSGASALQGYQGALDPAACAPARSQ